MVRMRAGESSRWQHAPPTVADLASEEIPAVVAVAVAVGATSSPGF